MARGLPDYNNPSYSVAVQSTDSGDVIPFTAGFNRVDGRGRVVFFDDFRNSLYKWVRDGEANEQFPQCVLIANRGLGNGGICMLDPLVNNGGSYLSKSFTLPPSVRYGIECGVYLDFNYGRFFMSVDYVDSAGNAYNGFLWVEETSGDFYIRQGQNNIKVIDNSSVLYLGNRNLVVKLVVNVQTGMFYRVFLNGNDYDLSAYPLEQGNPSLVGSILPTFGCMGKAGGKVEPAYLQYVILTTDEP